MGCGTSNQVHVVESQPAPSEKVNKTNSAKGRRNRKTSPAEGDTDSLVSQSDRGGSATSKASRHSGDSGFDDEEEQRNIHREILS
jgi:hypothetical protein